MRKAKMRCCVRPWILLQMTLEDRLITLMYDSVSSLMVLYTCSYFRIRSMKSVFAFSALTAQHSTIQ